MINVRHLFAKCINTSKCSRNVLFHRTFLSESYRCSEAWEKRLESPILKKVNARTLFQELDAQFSHFGRASAVDVDIFVNSCGKDMFIEDIETVLTLLRLCPDTGFTLPSTHHAVVRLLLDANRTETLLKIISEKLKYGIFPDHYCCNILMDTFLKDKKYAAAARIGVSQMLQEDWEDILTTRLSVYSCHMYLRNMDQTWYAAEEIVAPVPEPKELVKVRVKYLRAPYFDDHFDIKDPKLLVGKTLSFFSSKINGSEILNTSYLLIGLTLHQKWDQVTKLIQTLSSNKKPVFREAVLIARDSLQNLLVSEEKHLTSNPDTKQNESTQREKGTEVQVNIQEEIIQKVDSALQALETTSVDEDMLLEMETLVKAAVSQQESKDIEQLKQLYIKWDEDRISLLKKEQEEMRKEKVLKQIEEQKAQLIKEEQEIFFFDNEDKIDLLIEKRDKELASLDWIQDKKKSSKQQKEEADAAYIPPEVSKRHSTP